MRRTVVTCDHSNCGAFTVLGVVLDGHDPAASPPGWTQGPFGGDRCPDHPSTPRIVSSVIHEEWTP